MTTLLAWISTPLAYDFMQRGLLVAIIVGVICALLSCFLILKGWSLMGDAVSHAVLPGIVIAHILAIPLSVGAFAAGIACALATGYLRENSRVKEDAVMAIVFSGMFALGLVMFVKIDTDQHLNHILFGNMLGVKWPDVVETGIIAIPAIIIVLAKRRDLMLFCFDPAHARAIGLHVKLLHYGLLMLLALTIVVSLKAVGIILVVAMLIAPGAVGYLLTRQFERMMVIASLSAVSACVLGTLISFHLDAATGPTIVLVQAVAFCLALLFNIIRRRMTQSSQAPEPTVSKV